MQTVTIVLYNTIENNTKYIEQEIKKIYIETNYLLCMHELPHATAVVVMRRCRVMVFEKPEVIDKTG